MARRASCADKPLSSRGAPRFSVGSGSAFAPAFPHTKQEGRTRPMPSRRQFLGGAAATGVMFCSCGLLDAAHAQGTSRRQAVAVNGKTVKTIDVHAHCIFAETLPLVNNDRSIMANTVRGSEETLIQVDKRFAAMDAQRV